MEKEVTSFIIYLLGVFFVSFGHYSLLNLQSSLYVENGLGTTGLTVMYAASLGTGILLAPVFHKFFSIKTGVLIFEFANIIYCAVNFYPEFFTIIPGSLITGFGKNLFFICSGAYVVYYAKLFERSRSQNLEAYSNIFSGYVFSAIFAAQVVGNLVPFIVFRNSAEDDLNINKTCNMSNYVTKLMTSPPRLRVSDICGARDCQDPDVIEQRVSSYAPPNQTTVYIVLGIFVVTTFIGFMLHVIFSPNGRKTDDNVIAHAHENELCEAEVNTNKHNVNVTNNKERNDLESIVEGDEEVQRSKENTKNTSTENVSKFSIIAYEFKNLLLHLLNPYQLLLMWLQLHSGLEISFVTSEVTRAFVSCVYGLAEVGICTAIYGSSSFVTCVITGKLIGRYGRKVSLIVGFICNVGIHLFGLLWVPTETSELWTIYIAMIFYGIVSGTWSTLSTAAVAAFFPDKAKLAFNGWVIWNNSSFLVQFSWSTTLCVNAKIYVLLSSVCMAVLTQMIAEFKRDREMEKMQKKNDDFSTQYEITAL